MKAQTVQTFLDAADDLLAAQQQSMPQPLSEELKSLTKAYIARRSALMDEARLKSLRTLVTSRKAR